MITDKICYIHLRNRRSDGNYEVKGGATIAWVVDSQTGDIVIAKPARCMVDNPKQGVVGDVFQKEIGRQNAYNNLIFHKPLYIVKRDTLVHIATKQAEGSIGAFNTLSPSGTEKLLQSARSEINRNIESFMNSNWYEQIVRSHFVLHPDNRLEMADAASTPENIEWLDK